MNREAGLRSVVRVVCHIDTFDVSAPCLCSAMLQQGWFRGLLTLHDITDVVVVHLVYTTGGAVQFHKFFFAAIHYLEWRMFGAVLNCNSVREKNLPSIYISHVLGFSPIHFNRRL